MRRAAAWAALVAGGSLLALAAPAAAHGARSASTGARAAPACRPKALSGSLDLASSGGSATAPAGALLLRNDSSSACTLDGVPTTTVLSSGGSAIDLYEHKSVPHHLAPVALGPGRTAGASITWSEWTCPAGSYSLEVRFAGWSSAVDVQTGPPGYAGTACTSVGETVYVGPVTPIAS